MKMRESLRDDFIADLMKQASPEAPSGDFLEKVMEKVETMSACQPRRKPFFLFFRSLLPWILLVGVFVLFYIMYDMAFGNSAPGKEYFQQILLPSLAHYFDSFRGLASNKFYSIALVVIVCGGFLFGIERLISSRMSANRHYLV